MRDPFDRPPPLPRLRHDLSAYKTYRIRSPRDVLVVAVCSQVGCKAWRDGWDTVIDESTDLGQAQARFIRHRSGRTFREDRTDGGWTVFRFESHQRCFADHHTRPERYAVTGGVGHVNPLRIPPRLHARPEDWVEDISEHQQRIIDRQARG